MNLGISIKKGNLKLYIFELILFIILFVALIVSSRISYIFLAIFLFLYTFLLKRFVKYKKSLSIYKKQVLILMICFAFVYILIFYLCGLYKYDFSRTPTVFGFKTLIYFIIPLIVIIVTTEKIREAFISQNDKVIIFKKEVDLLSISTFINTVLIDILIYARVYDVTKFDGFLTLMGFIFFASISCNLFYNYISRRYGKESIIVYRLITILYMYIIPIIPNIYIFFRSFLRMVYPYLMYFLLEGTYSKANLVVAYKYKRRNIIGISITLVLATLVTMLISCQFRFGMIVIGSGSMSGSLEIGDVVVFESYKNQSIKKGDIIIFKKMGVTTIHRVVNIDVLEDEKIYYTKGDANEDIDDGYRDKNSIIGISKFKISSIGYPTIWMRELFTK